MSDQGLHFTFGWGVLVCAFGIVLNLFQMKKRGKSAKLLAGAFFILGVALSLIYFGLSATIAAPFFAIVIGILVYDALLRFNSSAEKSRSRR